MDYGGGPDPSLLAPVVPQVQELRRRLQALTLKSLGESLQDAVNWPLRQQVEDWAKLAHDAIAALGAAPTDLQAVGRAQGQHDASGARSQLGAVPSTCNCPDTAAEHLISCPTQEGRYP
jgi:hypothetical protein